MAQQFTIPNVYTRLPSNIRNKYKHKILQIKEILYFLPIEIENIILGTILILTNNLTKMK